MKLRGGGVLSLLWPFYCSRLCLLETREKQKVGQHGTVRRCTFAFGSCNYTNRCMRSVSGDT
jgi:hypothetical protein